jgi:SOS-response transcriptional repressor LexA
MGKSTLGRRMREAREAAKLSQGEVGKAVATAIERREGPFSASAVGQWESDKTEPSPSALSAFAKLTHADGNWLLTGLIVHQTGLALLGSASRGGRVVPKLILQDAICLPINYAHKSSVPTYFPCSDEAFVIDVFNRRNEPEYTMAADQIVIDPGTKPEPGDMVLALVDSEPVFGRYVRKRGGVVEIEALNDHWSAEQVKPARGDRIVGVMTEHARPRRR